MICGFKAEVEQGSQEALGLPKRQPEDETKGERGLNGEVRVLLWGSSASGRLRPPGPNASGDIHSVMSPRSTRAWSYLAQLVTRYLGLYLGCTHEFIPKPSGRRGPRH